MEKKDFLKLVQTDATLVSELMGVTIQAVGFWKKHGVPYYWFTEISKISDAQIKELREKRDKRKIENRLRIRGCRNDKK